MIEKTLNTCLLCTFVCKIQVPIQGNIFLSGAMGPTIKLEISKELNDQLLRGVTSANLKISQIFLSMFLYKIGDHCPHLQKLDGYQKEARQ